ncbi:hypothetical protein EVJ58_g9508 [Rhodofomes roseus]|uniref:Reverse transcriptase domain-containing protein n=1 Tax=Rhodofomes roseus TaxID=34475 RepID=A0A4Y9XVE7_9APHY|nr:hypothetical protein EVJ58_g9508 [Rhodofomes roseus]
MRSGQRGGSKWNEINQLLREQGIGVLAVQESHLDDAATKEVHDLYGRRLLLHNSPGPNATTAQGVCFVLNRELVDTKDLQVKEIIPGRAIFVKMKWHAGATLSLLNVYAPNPTGENAAFWRTLSSKLEDGSLPPPEVVLGDFNLVEEAIDRLPTREDPANAVNDLQNFIKAARVLDGWRLSEATTKDYTYPQRGGPSCSRLDRIYANSALMSRSLLWELRTTGVQTDHRLAVTRLTAAEAPFIGKGRWTLPLQLLSDSVFLNDAIRIGETKWTAAKAITGDSRTDTNNPQTLFKEFKDELRTKARNRMRTKVPRLKAAITAVSDMIRTVSAQTGFQEDPEKQREVGILRDRLRSLERSRHGQVQASTTARYVLNAECPSKYWSAVNRDKKPRDLFYSLRVPDASPPTYVSRSDKMAELARNYHDGLQREGDPRDEEILARERSIASSLESITARLPEEEVSGLSANFTRIEIEDSLKKAGPGKAAGLDGLPYELWLSLNEQWERSTSKAKHRFDCLNFMSLMYDDINRYGVSELTGFAEGWMCPLYKKKDRRDIANYRPITLLNSDYKVYTRMHATRIGRLVHNIVHPDQAGFIPGRKITDQTQTCRVMIDYAEAIEDNGMIVALDQEKAYDKIRHDYLWKVLERFGFPKKVIDRLRSLYEHASTIVILNGESSTPFRIVRGVRQGDPLSCLLFDMAIEPLACALRRSCLIGFRIPGTLGKLVANLFADDTSAFLCARDSWSGLWLVLDEWCLASGARFNGGKTEVVPIGSVEYRASVIATRCIDPLKPNERIPESVHIALDGEAVRVLGAWIGNGVDQVAVWAPALAKVDAFLERWSKCRPSLTGKKHIVQMGPGGITQYLTTVQGMPAQVEDALTTTIRTFVWDGAKTAPVAMEMLTRPVSEGGLGLLDIRARNEAIELMWTKRYLTLTDDRPRWAFAVDVLIGLAVSKDAGAIRKSAQLNTFLQSWSPAVHAASKLPPYIKRMIRVAKKYSVSFAALKLGTAMKNTLPIWYHLGANKRLRKLNNSKISDCLRDRHGVSYVADLLPLTQRGCLRAAGALSNDFVPSQCGCKECAADELRGCKHPLACCRAAATLLEQVLPKWHPEMDRTPDGLTLTTKRHEANAKTLEEAEGDMIFDPSLTNRGPIMEAFRVFVDPSVHNEPPAIRARPGRVILEEAITVYIVGPTGRKLLPRDAEPMPLDMGLVHYPQDVARSALVRPGSPREDALFPMGEVTAALKAVVDTPRDVPLTLALSSMTLAKQLVTKLSSWEDRGWIGVQGSLLFRALVNQLRQRCAPTTLHKVAGREEFEVRNGASDLAKTRYLEGRATVVAPLVNKRFDLSGAKLASLTQAIAYRGVLNKRGAAERPRTTNQVQRTLDHVGRPGDPAPPAQILWTSLRNKDIHRRIVDFLWKGLHDALKIGNFWTHIPGYEDRAECRKCGTRESLAHIIAECGQPGQGLIWAMTGALWRKKAKAWTKPSVDDVLAAGLGRYSRPENSKPKEDLARLWRIVVPEAAYLIWKLRCERVIEHADDPDWAHSNREIARRWYAAINRRLQLDLIATRRSFGILAKSELLVMATWTGTIGDEQGLIENWTKLPRVLVGIDPGFCQVAVDPG